MSASVIFYSVVVQALLTDAHQKPCTPDFFPHLLDKGFCLSTKDLFDLCVPSNEIAVSKECPEFNGSWCCFNPKFKLKPVISEPLSASITTMTTSSSNTTTSAATSTESSPSTTVEQTVRFLIENSTASFVSSQNELLSVTTASSLRSLHEDRDNHQDHSRNPDRDYDRHRSHGRNEHRQPYYSSEYREPFDWDWDRQHASRSIYDKETHDWVRRHLREAWDYAAEFVDGNNVKYYNTSLCGYGRNPHESAETRNQQRGEILTHLAQWFWDKYPYSNKRHLYKAMLNLNAYDYEFLRDCLTENYDIWKGTCRYEKYSRPDQICNNQDYPTWGAYNDIGQRITDIWNYEGGMWRKQKYHGYPDHDGSLGRLMNEKQLADLLDTGYHECYNFNTTTLHATFTQFIVHDIIRSAPYTITNEHGEQVKPRCCSVETKCLHHSCQPVLDDGQKDGIYDKYESCMELSDNVPGIDYCHPQAKDLRNLQTAYLDGSAIYGITCKMAAELRSFRDGKLRINNSYRKNVNLPDDSKPDTDECDVDYGDSDLKCFKSGDQRVNQHPGLTAWHTVFLRLHNIMASSCTELMGNYYFAADILDEICYQESRRYLQAILQNIFYRDHLPVELGDYVTEKGVYGLSLDDVIPYNPYVHVSVWPEYTYAAGRLHTLVSHWAQVQDPNRIAHGLNEPQSWYKINDFFHRGYGLVYSKNNVKELFENSLYDPEQCFDTIFAPELRQGWVSSSSSGPQHRTGVDMLAINLARGREFGIPWYTQLREFCGMLPIYDWKDLEGHFSQNCLDSLPDVYRNVKNIEGYVGMLCEKPMKEALVGPTSACILQRQYQNIREGDRFFFDRNGFTAEQMYVIRKFDLGKILCMTVNLDYVTQNVFRTPNKQSNKYISCDVYTDVTKEDLHVLWNKAPVYRGDYRMCMDTDPAYADAAYNTSSAYYSKFTIF